MNSSAIPVSVALHAIYTLWVAGLLVRDNYQRAFSEAQIAAMHDAKVELKRETFAPAPKTVERSPAVESQTAPEADAEEIMTVVQYLEQVENAETFYDILGVNPKADEAEIKKGYFRLARNFHPDRYHSQGGELLKRIQNAFTEIAQAHETLKHTETRETYDYRVRKELAEREKLSAAGGDGREVVHQERAAENFDTGFTLLMDGETEHAIPFLARAAHYSPKNARYRAYYGKALATDESQRHKAEAEIQTAIKLDPESPTFRLILAEFFVQFNLRKRAEGELKRLLAILPSNEDAKAMLANLKK
jgi:curved DNA-binding protein CbpA